MAVGLLEAAEVATETSEAGLLAGRSCAAGLDMDGTPLEGECKRRGTKPRASLSFKENSTFLCLTVTLINKVKIIQNPLRFHSYVSNTQIESNKESAKERYLPL